MTAARPTLLAGSILALALALAPGSAQASTLTLHSPILQGAAGGGWLGARGSGPALELRGAAGDIDVNEVVPLILGLFPGFGLGHLVAGDEDGFVFWLVVDLALLTAATLVGALVNPPGAIFGSLAGLAWLVLHVVQGLDAYAAAGGPAVLSGSPVPAPADPLARWRSGWVPVARVEFGAVD